MAQLSQNLTFQEISRQCNNMLSNVNDSIIRKLYSKFSFLYINCNFFSQSKDLIKNYFLQFFKIHKFITYDCNSEFHNFINFSSEKQEICQNSSINNVDVILCVENICLFIEQIDEKTINEFFKETNSVLVNANKNTGESTVINEILGFTENFKDIIKKNDFIKYTISSIICYTIRRYYFPSNFFKDPSFFNFDKNVNNKIFFSFFNKYDDSQIIDDSIQAMIEEIFKSKSENEYLSSIKNCQSKIKNKGDKIIKPKILEFHENDFIQLRQIYFTQYFCISLVIHIDSFYVFAIKYYYYSINENEKNHEIEFVKNYSHRCLNKFYGFVKDNKRKIKGLVYEFNSNGSLSDYLKNSKRINDIFCFMTMIRIFNGIKYLQSNNLIHRDIKPDNILINHNFVPFISDFETIRNLETDTSSFTNDIGSYYYISPEQYNGLNISYPTDIYSFGCIIYFLFERKTPINVIKRSNNEKVPLISCAPKNIKDLYLLCVENDQNNRIKIESIENIIKKEINSFYYIEKFLNEEYMMVSNELIQYFHENIILLRQNQKELDLYMDKFLNFWFVSLFNNVVNTNKAHRLFSLGCIYLTGHFVEQNIIKAIEYLESSAKLNYSFALLYLGVIYSNGEGIEKDYEKAIEYFESSAKQQNSWALVFLGEMYLKGCGIKMDYSKAIEYYELASKQNNSLGSLSLALIYLYGCGVEIDYTKSIEYCELAVKQNNSNALNLLGDLYLTGTGVKQSYSKAIEYFEKSAKQNNSFAFFRLGSLYINGCGVKQSYSKAIEYFEKSAKQKNIFGLSSLGDMYLNGHGVKQSYSKAIEYYELSLKPNDQDDIFNPFKLYSNENYFLQEIADCYKTKEIKSDVLYKLGQIYYNGYEVKPNYEKAIDYFERSANLNNAEALRSLGIIYCDGCGVQHNFVKAIDYLERSANQNDSESLMYLGMIYLNGYGVEQNYIKAKEYFEKSAQQNNSVALYYLGNIYLNGYEVKQNYLKAKEYFEKSAQYNNPDALFSLGNLYLNGYGVEQNYLKAIEYFEKSAQKNNSNALFNLGVIYYKGDGIKQNYSKAKEYFEKSAQYNNPDALFNLGLFYFKGYGVKQNYEKAKEYFEKSAQYKNSKALYNLGFLHYNGLGVKQNYEKAKECFELSIKFGDDSGYCFLGLLYLLGQGVEKDVSKAKEYFNKFLQNESIKSINFFQFFYENLSLFDSYWLISFFKNIYQMYFQQKDFQVLNIFQDKLIDDFLQFKYYYSKLSLQNKKGKSEQFFNDIMEFLNINLNFTQIEFEKYIQKFSTFYEWAAEFNNPESLNILGVKYYYGCCVKTDYQKAKEYFDKSAKQNDSAAFFYLGLYYYNGLGIPRDLLRAEYYFNLSAKQNNSNALNFLGNMHINGDKPKYDKAHEYYKMAAKLNNSDAFYNLGKLYFKGLGIQKNNTEALKYYELSAKLNNPKALIKLGNLYSKGIIVQQNSLKAKEYYELASLQNYPSSFFYLGDFYLNRESFIHTENLIETNFSKAIQNFKKCSEIDNFVHLKFFINNEFILPEYQYNKYKYRSCNDLGLIYIILLNNKEDAEKYLKLAAFAEYPFGQNNFGLLSQFYLNKKENAEYMYKRASQNHFALAEYNIGYLFEEKGKINQAIEYYIKASEDESQPLVFQNHYHYDKRLEISKTFIICLANLKLVEYYFSRSEYEISKKYFIKSFQKMILDSYKFNFILNNNQNAEENFSYLKSFIFNYPPFNFISSDLYENDDLQDVENVKSYNNRSIRNNIKHTKSNKTIETSIGNNDNIIVFKDPEKLFRFVIKNNEMKIILINEINNIILEMKNLLYNPPYNILFGRICFEKLKQEPNKTSNNNINNIFYQGLGDII